MHARKQIRYTIVAALLLGAFLLPNTAAFAVTRFSSSGGEKTSAAAAFSFDSIWFYRDGTKVIPEISLRWLTVVFDPRYNTGGNDLETTYDSFIQEKAKALLSVNDRLVDFLYDQNLAEDACFITLREGLTREDIAALIQQLNQDEAVAYVHPAVVLDNKTYAFFNVLQLEWKTGTDRTQRDALLKEAHVVFDEKESTYAVDVLAMPYFTALNLLAEDIRVLRAAPYFVEIKPSLRAQLSFFMNGANIGDSIPFSLAITFSDRVNVDPSSLAIINLKPANLQKELFDCTFDPYDYSKAVTKSPVIITGRVKFYAPGEFIIPSVVISYSCPSCSGSTVRSIETKPVSFKVASIIPAVKSENRLIVPDDRVAPDYRFAELRQQSLRFLWLAVICCAGFILCAAWLLRIRYRASAVQRRINARTREDQLADELRVLVQSSPSTPHWSYLAGLGTVLREYLVARYRIDVKYHGGNSTQFLETIKAHIPHDCIKTLRPVLTAIDNCVSLEAEQYEDINHLQHEIVKVLDLSAKNAAAPE
jgi:hypothetical protein